MIKLFRSCDKNCKKFNCKVCKRFKKENKKYDFGKCINPYSTNYLKEVYDYSCCNFVCNLLDFSRRIK